jgi:membrane-associated protein
MELLQHLIQFIRDPAGIAELGYPTLALIVFLETGAMVFFLPGDSLLVTAGVYAAAGKLSLLTLNMILVPAAILGPVLSYWIGATAGPMLFSRPRSRFFRPEHIQLAHQFYEKHGGKALVIARFMPIMRTFVPIVAGIGRMSYPRYAAYTVIGAAGWVVSMTLLGFFVGQTPLGKHIEIVIIAVVLFSIMPGVIAWLRARKGARVANGEQG